jgi:hypothetical protein
MLTVDPYASIGRVPLVGGDERRTVVVAMAELLRTVMNVPIGDAFIPLPSVEHPDVGAVPRSSVEEFQPWFPAPGGPPVAIDKEARRLVMLITVLV